MAAGYYHSLALLADGTVVAWGDNEHGELGQGNTTGPETCSGHPCSKVPIPVPGLSNVIAIDGGNLYSLALLADGTVMAWGFDFYGTLGDAPHEDLNGCECVSHPVPVPGASGAIAISAGWNGGSALRADGTIIDWGYNEYGQVGDGERLEYAACECRGPTQVVGLKGASQTTTGGYHGLALLSGGAVSGWGYGPYDQLGAQLTTGCYCTATPIVVAGISGPSAISAGVDHNLARMPDGSVEAWGKGSFGQLGNGGLTERAMPAPVPGLSGASAVDAGDHTSFAIVGASQALSAKLTGTGKGSVGGERIVCPATACSADFPQGRVVVLRAEAATGSRFDGFSGACSGTGLCKVTMDQAKTVTATFSAIPPSGTKIASAKIDAKKKSATFSFKAAGIVDGFECKLTRPKKAKEKAHKAAAAKFTKCASPKTYKHLAPGGYTFAVRAFNAGGKDPKPATRTFKIKKVGERKGHHA